VIHLVKEIQITKGKIVLVDDEDFEYLSSIPWYFNGRGYAVNKSRFFNEDGSRKQMLMHRLLLNAPEDMKVDHINNNTLDNRKSNLRLASSADNSRNMRKPNTNTSGYKGVSKTRSGNWHSSISYYDKTIHLGTFDNKHDAARMYNFWAVDLYGEFAQLNTINEMGAIK
jgi:hypothetical protein